MFISFSLNIMLEERSAACSGAVQSAPQRTSSGTNLPLFNQ